MRRLLVAALFAAGAIQIAVTPAAAQEGVTVSGLLANGWQVVGVFPSPAGPGILLQREQSLEMCFVAETSDSSDVKTQYCKPVH